MIRLFGKSQIMDGDETFTVKRDQSYLGGTSNYVGGKLVKLPPCVFQAIGNIQPINGRDLLIVPEADRFKEQYWLFLPSQIFTDQNGLEVKDITSMIINDIVVRNCVNYHVQSVEDWGSYARARIMRVDVGPSATP